MAAAAALLYASHSFDVFYLGKSVILMLRMQYERSKNTSSKTTPESSSSSSMNHHPQDAAHRLLQTWFITPATVTTRDLDFNWHMNNARYSRHGDFARFKLILATGLFVAVDSLQCALVVSAMAIKFRRELGFAQDYEIWVRLVGYDERHWYVEQVFAYHEKEEGTSKRVGDGRNSHDGGAATTDPSRTPSPSTGKVTFDGTAEAVRHAVDDTTRQFQAQNNLVVAAILTTRLTMTRSSDTGKRVTPADVLQRMGLGAVLPTVAPPPQEVLDWNDAVQASSNRWTGTPTMLRSKL